MITSGASSHSSNAIPAAAASTASSSAFTSQPTLSGQRRQRADKDTDVELPLSKRGHMSSSAPAALAPAPQLHLDALQSVFAFCSSLKELCCCSLVSRQWHAAALRLPMLSVWHSFDRLSDDQLLDVVEAGRRVLPLRTLNHPKHAAKIIKRFESGCKGIPAGDAAPLLAVLRSAKIISKEIKSSNKKSGFSNREGKACVRFTAPASDGVCVSAAATTSSSPSPSPHVTVCWSLAWSQTVEQATPYDDSDDLCIHCWTVLPTYARHIQQRPLCVVETHSGGSNDGGDEEESSNFEPLIKWLRQRSLLPGSADAQTRVLQLFLDALFKLAGLDSIEDHDWTEGMTESIHSMCAASRTKNEEH
jgi:hypothetical protein